METIREKVAYLKGMLDAEPKMDEERLRFLFEKILALMDQISDELDAVSSAQAELEDYVAEIDLDLAALEDDFFAEEDEHRCACHHDHDDMVQMECPECGEEVEFEEDFLYDDDVQITCPSCGATVYDSADMDDDDLFEEDFDGPEDED